MKISLQIKKITQVQFESKYNQKFKFIFCKYNELTSKFKSVSSYSIKSTQVIKTDTDTNITNNNYLLLWTTLHKIIQISLYKTQNIITTVELNTIILNTWETLPNSALLSKPQIFVTLVY